MNLFGTNISNSLSLNDIIPDTPKITIQNGEA